MRRNSYGYPCEDDFDQSKREKGEQNWPSGWFILPALMIGALLWWGGIAWL